MSRLELPIKRDILYATGDILLRAELVLLLKDSSGNWQPETFRVDTGSGDVEVRLLAPCDDIEIDTGSGSVTLAVPEGLSAQVEIETGSGGIDLGFPVQVRKLESDHVTGQIGDGRGRLRIDTGSGSVRLIKI